MEDEKKTGPSPNGGNGRGENGRFLPGNSGGPGNPYAARVGEWRQALADAVTPEVITEVTNELVKAAKAGQPWAVKEIFDRCLGKATQPIEVEAGQHTWQAMVAALQGAANGSEANGE